jgi:hypothetical protein
MSIQFWQTPMGHRFFEATLPELIKQISRVADALEALLVQRGRGEPAPKR